MTKVASDVKLELYVASRYEISQRCESLSIHHYRIAASLDDRLELEVRFSMGYQNILDEILETDWTQLDYIL